MKAKWVNIVDSLPRNEEDIKDRYIEISRNRHVEQRADISKYREIDISKGKKENKANNK